MSWSVSAVGKKDAVLKTIAGQFDSQTPCMEPEESVRQGAKSLLLASIGAQAEGTPLRVVASGNQQFKDWTNKTGVSNSVSLQVEVLRETVLI